MSLYIKVTGSNWDCYFNQKPNGPSISELQQRDWTDTSVGRRHSSLVYIIGDCECMNFYNSDIEFMSLCQWEVRGSRS